MAAVLVVSTSIYLVYTLTTDDKARSLNDYPDFDSTLVNMETEKAHVDALFSHLENQEPLADQSISDANGITVYSSEVVEDFVPNNATIGEVAYWENKGFPAISIDYWLDETRVTLMYFIDGTIHKVVNNGELMVSNINDEELDIFDYKKDTRTITR